MLELEPAPMQVVHGAVAGKDEVLDDIKRLDLWPATYVSERMEELPLHWHDFDNCGYVLEGSTYVLDEQGDRVPLGPGDKLIIPRGAVHAEGAVTERTVHIVGLPMAANLLDQLIDLRDPGSSPQLQAED
jgi:mannose-6-phosphate isomerase-like protein (cupin superfamily)